MPPVRPREKDQTEWLAPADAARRLRVTQEALDGLVARHELEASSSRDGTRYLRSSVAELALRSARTRCPEGHHVTMRPDGGLHCVPCGRPVTPPARS